MIVVHDPLCQNYSAPLHPETPVRISKTAELLRAQHDLVIQWESPSPAEEKQILRAHSREHLAAVRKAEFPFDDDTPNYQEIYRHALRAAGSALRAKDLALSGKTAFSLMRPPGHHATRDRAMGFCYFNSIAVAALEAVEEQKVKTAIFDFDVHHGNGTEAILQDRESVDFFSVHQFPCYPGSGRSHVGKNCFNYPVAPHTPREDYRKTLALAFKELLAKKPGLIAVSAGFDAYKDDPLADGTLLAEDYRWLGEEFRKSGIPCFAVLEGGYSKDLPRLVEAFLQGLEG